MRDVTDVASPFCCAFIEYEKIDGIDLAYTRSVMQLLCRRTVDTYSQKADLDVNSAAMAVDAIQAVPRHSEQL